MDAHVLIAELAGTLLRQLDDLAEEMVQRILAEEPSYRRGETVPDADLRRSVRDNAAMVIATVAAPGHDPQRFDPPRETGRRRAEQGLPLEALLHSYRIGGRLIWEQMVVEASTRHPEHLGLLLSGATQVWDVIDTFSTVVAEAYRERELQLARRSEERGATLADALLEGRGDNPTIARDAEAMLGSWQQCGIAVVVSLREGSPLGLVDPARRLRERGLRSVWTRRPGGPAGVVALGPGGIEQLRRALTDVAAARMGISPAQTALTRIPAAERLAATAAATVVHAPLVAVLDDHLPAALVVRAPDVARRLVECVLGPILQLPPAEADVLLETVQVYLDVGGSPARAAQALYCHPNTLGNRLRRVAELAGADPREPRGAADLALALVAYELDSGGRL